jgi:hypothetical protein
MSEGIKQHADTGSAEFKQRVEAGLNSTADTKNWQARVESENTQPAAEIVLKESSAPLFIRDIQGNDGSPQDEKDETEE